MLENTEGAIKIGQSR